MPMPAAINCLAVQQTMCYTCLPDHIVGWQGLHWAALPLCSYSPALTLAHSLLVLLGLYGEKVSNPAEGPDRLQ